jgi:hypothetical protein
LKPRRAHKSNCFPPFGNHIIAKWANKRYYGQFGLDFFDRS